MLIGLAVTLCAVAGFSWYALYQLQAVRSLQTDTVDRNRRDSLQLLRIQNNLNAMALAMRDMAEGTEPYPLIAWKSQFDRMRFDLEDALKLEEQLAPATRNPDQKAHLSNSLTLLWGSVDEVFRMAAESREAEARQLVRGSLEPQQASLGSLVARMLVANNEAEEQAGARIDEIYRGVERNVYLFVAAVIVAIVLASLYLIQTNRRIFARISALSEQRRELAQQLIGVQEQIFLSVSRELHDEFGQILTAVGAMLLRAEKRGLPPESPLREQMHEIRDIVQQALERVRTLSTALHPSLLDDYGLEKALEWHTAQVGKQTGLVIRYEKSGNGPVVDGQTAIHVYRIVQEALTNVVRHSQATEAWVRLRLSTARLRVEVEDHGIGIPPKPSGGLGLVAMRERAEILRGRLDLARPKRGGTLVTLDIPVGQTA